MRLDQARLMIGHASLAMYKPRRAVSLLWAWVWACCVPGGWAAAAIPSGLTTEAHIFTGPTTSTAAPPPPPENFVISYKEAFASFVHLTFSYNATFNLTRIVVTYEDSMDTSRHVITLNINTGGSGFDPTTLYDPASGRLGIVFRLGGLYRRRRYSLQVVAFQGSIRAAHSRLAFLTGEDDGEDKLYNLTGIILVLGISTIIMVVVMVCVGYEKLIHQKKEECCSFICCRKRKKRPPKSSISPEPLVVRDGRGAGESPSTSSQRY
ncbi:uncharacterized protein [Cherax quadricarinatus]|uniref:uncharacterized protein n=1 Tax=Cherax quadricarinatus TaxID=27406 RepID=UPI00387E69F7